MSRVISALVCGLIFGAGLLISGMTETQKVQGFLDITGAWDPSLAVVMAAALAVTFLGFVLARRQAAPVFVARALWPNRHDIDAPLVAGAAMFGIGWGLIGFCPGPAIADLSTGAPAVILFVVAMAVGMAGNNLMRRRNTPPVGKEPVLEASCG